MFQRCNLPTYWFRPEEEEEEEEEGEAAAEAAAAAEKRASEKEPCRLLNTVYL